MWRCVNDIWGYCKEMPEWEKKAQVTHGAWDKRMENIVGGICKLDPRTCGHLATATEIIKPNPMKTNPVKAKKK